MADGTPNLSDADLLRRYRDSADSRWLGMLLERHSLLVFGVCMKYLKNQEEARDAVQQVFLKVLTELDRYDVTYFKSWLYTVARNHCLMQLREKGLPLQDIDDGSPLPDEPDGEGSADIREEKLESLEAALERLPEEQRRCITLFYFEEKSYNDICAQTGLTYMQVKSHIQNGKRNLRNFLSAQNDRL